MLYEDIEKINSVLAGIVQVWKRISRVVRVGKISERDQIKKYEL